MKSLGATVLFLCCSLLARGQQVLSLAPPSLAHLSLECDTASAANRVANQAYYMSEREHRQTLKVTIQNLGTTPANVVPIVYFFTRDASRPSSDIALTGSRSNAIMVPANGSQEWLADAPVTSERVDNFDYAGGGYHTGRKPAGWIVGFLIGGSFYPVKASNETLLENFTQSDVLKKEWAEYEEIMPRDTGERQKKEENYMVTFGNGDNPIYR